MRSIEWLCCWWP